MSKEYVYLLLVDVDGEPFLAETPHPAEVGDMVEFREDCTRRMGRVAMRSFEDPTGDSYAMLAVLKPVCQAVKIWRTDWEAGNPGQ